MAQSQDSGVFLAYSSKDAEFIEAEVQPEVIRQGFKVIMYKDFLPGTNILTNVTQALFECKKILLLLTNNSWNSPWCTLELIIALEKSQQTNKGSLVLLCGRDIDITEIPIFEFMCDTPKISLEDDFWKQQLEEELKRETTFISALVGGNVAHGQLWSHYYGLLQYVLRELENRIKTCQWYDQHKFPIQLYELVPDSCQCPFIIKDNVPAGQSRIVYVGNLDPIEYYRAGNKRIVKLPVYKIKDDNGQEYFCVCEMPAVLRAIHLMKENGIAPLQERARKLQWARFCFTLENILHHPNIDRDRTEGDSPDKIRCGKATLVKYDDRQVQPSAALLQEIKQYFSRSTTEETKAVVHMDHEESESLYQREEPVHDVYIKCDQNDIDLANSIIEKLKNESITAHVDAPGQRKLGDRSGGKRLIMIFSNSTKDLQWFDFQFLLALQKRISKGQLSVIPVLRDVGPEVLPQLLRWIVYVDVQAGGRYMDLLMKAIKGNVRMGVETLLPAGNVADGLSWGYVVNYLKFVLLDPEIPENHVGIAERGFTEIIDETFETENVENVICPKKLFILVPKSCDCPDTLTEADDRISVFHDIEATYRNIAGTIRRPYHCTIYKITTENDQDIYFVAQFAAAVQCLNEMHGSGIAGLSKEQMYKESERFCKITQELLEGPVGQGFSHRCEIVNYDDTRRKLGDVMIDQIRMAMAMN